MLIRKAVPTDIPLLLKIYNKEVVSSFATLDVNKKSLSEWERWFFRHNIKNHPLIVSEIDGAVVGYASLSSFREKDGYSSSVELSIYVDSDFRRHGIATELMREIITEAKADPSIHSIISIITAPNDPSRELHEKFGFEYCGRVREAGCKFGEYVDINYYQLLV